MRTLSCVEMVEGRRKTPFEGDGEFLFDRWCLSAEQFKIFVGAIDINSSYDYCSSLIHFSATMIIRLSKFICIRPLLGYTKFEFHLNYLYLNHSINNNYTLRSNNYV